MANRIVIGIDPGLSGALCLLHDGGKPSFIDMPTQMSAKTGKQLIDCERLSAFLRGIKTLHNGAYITAVIEAVGMRPINSRGSDQKAAIGYGMILGIVTALRIDHQTVQPQTWKKHHGLIGTAKDAARVLALAKFPEEAGLWLNRKKDNGRADALMIALWAHETEAWIS